jgi:hypothetical protein
VRGTLKKVARAGKRTRDLLSFHLFSHHSSAEPKRLPKRNFLRPIPNFAHRGEVFPWGWNSLFAPPFFYINNRECSPLGVNKGVNILRRGQILPLGARGEVKNGPLTDPRFQLTSLDSGLSDDEAKEALCETIDLFCRNVELAPVSIAKTACEKIRDRSYKNPLRPKAISTTNLPPPPPKKKTTADCIIESKFFVCTCAKVKGR